MQVFKLLIIILAQQFNSYIEMDSKEKEWFIKAPWGKISVIAWGDCFNPPVLMVHGNRDTAATFRPLVSLLPDNFYYIAIDLPGCGKSDWYPPGMMISVYDLVYNVTLVVRHFRWEKFVFVGHSMGTALGRLYDLAYPKKISKLIELDPVFGVLAVPDNKFNTWYHNRFTSFYEDYQKFNSPRETAPKQTIQQAIQSLMQNTSGLTEEMAAARVERMVEPAGNGLVRFTFDNRYKKVTLVPLSPDYMKKLFTRISTPTLCLVSEFSIEKSQYYNAEFSLDESSYPSGNCKVRRVPGTHDFHYQEPETIAPYIAQFLLYGLDAIQSKAKL